MISQNWSRFSVHVFFVLVLAGSAAEASHEEAHGLVLYGTFQGSANDIGVVNRLDAAGGYRFNRFVEFDVGIPAYFVKPSDSTSTTTGSSFMNGFGNVYGNLRMTFTNSNIQFTSILTGTAPTGEEKKGFSTGRGSVDWTNVFSHNFYRALPYASVGVANTVSDTSFFVRPYSSIGLVGHVEVGSTFRVSNASSVGVSAYKVMPSGEQTIISRLVPRETSTPASSASNAANPNPPGRGVGRGLGRGRNTSQETPVPTFETVSETIFEAEFAKDHGVSAWWNISPASEVNFYVGFSRSFPFDLNTFFFGAGFNLGSIIRRAGHP